MTDRDAARFLEHLAAVRGSSAHTLASYQTVLQQVAAYGPLAELTTRDLEHYFAGLAKAKLAAATQAQRYSVLQQFYKFLQARGGLAASPLAPLPRPKRPIPLPKAPDKAQLEHFLASCPQQTPADLRLRALALLLYGGGLRVSEALGLRLNDLPAADAPPTLRVTGKRDKTRLVPVGAMALEAVQQYIHHGRAALVHGRADNPWLFPAGNKGNPKPLSRVRAWQLLKAQAALAGLEDFSPHQLRHACATHMLENSADLRLVQLLLGHADLNTTQIYTKVLRERLAATVAKKHPLVQQLQKVAALGGKR